jgi:hypothetical protein
MRFCSLTTYGKHCFTTTLIRPFLCVHVLSPASVGFCRGALMGISQQMKYAQQMKCRCKIPVVFCSPRYQRDLPKKKKKKKQSNAILFIELFLFWKIWGFLFVVVVLGF